MSLGVNARRAQQYYNREVRNYWLIAAAMLLSACSRDIQTTDAVRQDVLEYLNARSAQTGLDMNMMQLEVTSVSFEKTQARATVFFRPKGGGEGGMSMSYTLD